MIRRPDPSLLDLYDALLFDLDGTLMHGAQPIPHAPEAVQAARDAGRTVVFATNNASRPPGDVHRHLAELGIDLGEQDVVTSAMAGAQRLAEVLDAGATVLAVGGDGVRLALEGVGLRPVRPQEAAEEDAPAPEAVLQGYGRDVAWTDLAEVAYAIAAGARWVATNTDTTLPNDHFRPIKPVRVMKVMMTKNPVPRGTQGTS